MKEIPLTRGRVALVDDEDYELVSRYKWHCMTGRNTPYAATDLDINGKRMAVYMHQMLMGTVAKGLSVQVDHVDGSGLNNQRSNLRVSTHSQNLMNSGPCTRCKTGFKGVFWVKGKQRYRAEVRANNATYHVGYFDDPVEAAKARDTVARRVQGEFAYLNFPEEVA